MHTRTRSTITRRVSGALALLLALQAGLAPGVARAGGGSGGVTLGSAYLGGNTITEQGGLAVALSATTADNGNVLTVTKNPVGAQSGAGVVVTMGATTTGPALSLAGGTSLFLESTDGSTSAVSGAATGRIRYNNGTGTWQVSTQAGAWASISTGGTTLQAAYNGGNTIAEAGGLAVAISSTTADNAGVLTVTKNPVGAQSGTGLAVSMGATTTGDAITASLTNGATGSGLRVTGGTAANTAIVVIQNSANGGMSVIDAGNGGGYQYSGNATAYSANVGGGALPGVNISMAGASSSAGVLIQSGAATTGPALSITQTAGFTGAAVTVVQGANTVLQLDKFGTLSSPYNGNAQSEHFGLSSQAAGGDTAIGFSCQVTGAFDVSVGSTSGVNNASNCAVTGYGSNSGSNSCTISGCNSVTALGNGSPRVSILGQGCNGSFSDGILLGVGTVNTAANQFVAGSNTSTISDVYFGKGVTNATPTVVTIHGTGGTGAGIAGAGLTIAGGISGDAATGGGSVLVKVASAGSGTALTTALTIANTTDATFAGNVAITGKLTVTGAIDPPSVSLSSGTALFFDSANGNTAGLSAAGHGRLRYNDTGHVWEQSVNGGAYSTIGGGGGTLQTAYNGGSAIATAGALEVQISDSLADDGNLLTLLKLPGSAHAGYGIGLTMNSNCTGDGIVVVNAGSGLALNMTNTAGSGGVLSATNGGPGGVALRATSTSTSPNTCAVIGNTGTNGADVLAVNMSSPGGAGGGIVVTNNGVQTGPMIYLSGGIMTANTGPMLSGIQTWNNAGVTFTGVKFNVTDSASAAASLLLDLQLAGTSKLSVTKAGKLTSTTNGIITIANGLGAGPHIVGPTDQNFRIKAGAGLVALLEGDAFTSVQVSNNAAMSTGGTVSLSGGGYGVNLDAGGFRPASAGINLGAAATGWASFYLDYTNTATVGNVTINKPSGSVNMAAVSSTFTVTNSLVTANSHVIITLASDPGVALSAWTVCSAGSFTINTRPATVNQTSFDFVVVGAD